MREIDYDAITNAIVKILDDAMPEVEVSAEAPILGLVSPMEVGVYLSTEHVTEDALSMDDPYSVTLMYVVLCTAFSPDGARAAITERGGLVFRAKKALHADRTLDGNAITSQIGRIDYESAETETGHYAAARMDFKVYIQ